MPKAVKAWGHAKERYGPWHARRHPAYRSVGKKCTEYGECSVWWVQCVVGAVIMLSWQVIMLSWQVCTGLGTCQDSIITCPARFTCEMQCSGAGSCQGMKYSGTWAEAPGPTTPAPVPAPAPGPGPPAVVTDDDSPGGGQGIKNGPKGGSSAGLVIGCIVGGVLVAAGVMFAVWKGSAASAAQQAERDTKAVPLLADQHSMSAADNYNKL
jgi:hypothetical protein